MQNNKRPEFRDIKDWLQEHLSKKNNLILANNAETREVIVNSMKGPVALKIPIKNNNIDAFKDAWVNVYLACLDYLNKYVSDLFLKDSLVLEDENTVIVGQQKFVFNNHMDSVTYINTLERITIAYDVLCKIKKEENPIQVKETSVQIDNPATIKSKLEQLPKQEINYEKVSTFKPKISEVVTFNNQENFNEFFTCQKLSDNDVLEEADLKNLSQEQIVFITCTNLTKGEDTYRDNAELLIDKMPNIKRAAFISGRVIKVDQINKEVSKIMKLCSDTLNTNIIMYEINNEAIQSMGADSQAIKEAIVAIDKLLDIINAYKCKVLVCLDNETKNVIDKFQYSFKHPFFIRVSPREINATPESANLVVMDPQYDNDQVVIKNEAILNNIGLVSEAEYQPEKISQGHLANA